MVEINIIEHITHLNTHKPPDTSSANYTPVSTFNPPIRYISYSFHVVCIFKDSVTVRHVNIKHLRLLSNAHAKITFIFRCVQEIKLQRDLHVLVFQKFGISF